MSSLPTGNLTKANRERLREAYQALSRAVALHDRCERCGLDTGERKELLEFLVDRYQKLAAEFGLSLGDKP